MPRTAVQSRLGNLKQENPMNVINHYIGFDVHKKSISYCVRAADGTIVEEGTLRATHLALREWAEKRREPWHGAMEATVVQLIDLRYVETLRCRANGGSGDDEGDRCIQEEERQAGRAE